MNSVVKEWIEKAEGDYGTAGRELQVVGGPNFDAVALHSHACVEKLVKGLLIHLGVTPPKTHDIVFLGRLLAPVCAEWSWPEDELRFLTWASIGPRYPGQSVDRQGAEMAFDFATRIRAKLLPLFQ
jgi:HEPN domain-containing protein